MAHVHSFAQSTAAGFAAVDARACVMGINGQTFDRSFLNSNMVIEMSAKNAPAIAPVYSPTQQDMLATVMRATLNLAASPLAHSATLALAEIDLPGMVTSNGRDMEAHRREVLADITARTSASTAKAQFSRGLYLFEKFEADVRAAHADPSPVATLLKALAARDIRDQYTLDVARGKVTPKVTLTAVQKAQAALDKARDKEAAEIASAARAREANSPAGRLSVILAAIEPGGFSDDDMATIAKALQNAPRPAAQVVAQEQAIAA